MDVDTDLEELMGYLGEFGKYQRNQFLLHLLTALTAGMHMLSLVTVAAIPEHRCLVPDETRNNTYPWKSELVLSWVPLKDNETLDSCHIFDFNTDGIKNGTTGCESWVYDPTYHPSSRVIEWDMVCDDRWKRAIIQSAYMLGVLTGAVTLGRLADRIGRKKVMYASCVLQLILGILVAFIPEFYTFLIVRYLFGIFGSAGAYNTAFVLSMELVGATKRSACGLSFQFTFAVGMILVAFWGWLVPDRFWLQIIYGSHGFLLIGHWWLVDESPRWLWGNGKRDEAIDIVHKGLRINGKEDLLDVAHFRSQTKPMFPKKEDYDEDEGAGLLSLFKTPNLRNRTFNVGLNWFANSLAYYGLSLNTGSLPGNPYLMLFASAAVELPCYVATTYLMDKLGRRSLISAFMVLGGLACIISAVIPQTDELGRTLVICVVLLAKLLIAGSFAIICNYTAELFPTVVRNTAYGIGSMCARLSGTLCPLITLLDSLDKTLPIIIFASVAVISGILSLFLPETLNKPMPQSLEDGERFGEGDTAFSSCFRSNRNEDYVMPLRTIPQPSR